MPSPGIGEKIWRLGRDNWIAGAGSLRGVPRPPNPWPDPTPEGAAEPRTPKEWAHAVAAQLMGGDYTTGPRYSVAVIGTRADRSPELFQVSNDKGDVQIATVGTVFTASYAEATEVRELIPARLADNLDNNRDLVVAMASRTLRGYGHELNPLGGPSISWPVYFYQWDLAGVAVIAGQLIPESQGAAAEWRHWTNATVAARQPRVRARITEKALDFQSRGLWPEIDPQLRIELHWSLPSPSPDPATDAPIPGADPATGAPTETPPNATLPA
jgi:hypothetical protein